MTLPLRCPRLVPVLVAVCAAHVLAQTPQQVFRATLDLVQIDITALNKMTGLPAKGLTSADFRIFEDGQPREILGFAEIDIPDSTAGPVWLRDTKPDVRGAGDGRVLVLLIDDASMPNALEAEKYRLAVETIAGELFDRMGPTDVTAVLCTFSSACAQDFTSDRTLLRQTVKRFMPRNFSVGGGYSWDRQSVGTATNVARYLREQPGRRKALIYLSRRVPVKPDPWPPITCPAERCVSLEQASTQQQTMKLFEEALRAKVAVYGINPATLVGRSTVQLEPVADAEPLGTLALKPFSARNDSLPAETGGFTISNPEEMRNGIAQILREAGSYYLIGYERSTSKSQGYREFAGLRPIRVESLRPDVEVRSKVGFVDPPAAGTRPAETGVASVSAITGILPQTDLALVASVAPFAVPNRAEAAVAVVVAVEEPLSVERSVDQLELELRAFSQRGDPRLSKTINVNAPLVRRANGSAVFEILAVLDLKPGQYALRFGGRSAGLQKVGSVYVDLEVPDFRKAPLSLSGVIVAVEPGPPSGPKATLTGLMPVVPTTMRTYTATDQVRVFMRIYQGGSRSPSPVNLEIQIVDGANRIAHVQQETLSASPETDFSHVIPTSQLTAGPYLMRLKATTAGVSAERHVTFAMR